MKDLIKQLLRETLEELATKPKQVFGRGAFHKVYRSNKHPNRLFKVGDEDTVSGWLSVFKDNPKYFPKVYRTFPYKDSEYVVVEIEMLNTGDAEMEYEIINDFIIDVLDKIHCGFIGVLNFYESNCFDEIMDYAEEHDDNVYGLLEKWVPFLSEVAPIVYRYLGRDVDLHGGNVAYDNQGNLKLIDI